MGWNGGDQNTVCERSKCWSVVIVVFYYSHPPLGHDKAPILFPSSSHLSMRDILDMAGLFMLTLTLVRTLS